MKNRSANYLATLIAILATTNTIHAAKEDGGLLNWFGFGKKTEPKAVEAAPQPTRAPLTKILEPKETIPTTRVPLVESKMPTVEGVLHKADKQKAAVQLWKTVDNLATQFKTQEAVADLEYRLKLNQKRVAAARAAKHFTGAQAVFASPQDRERILADVKGGNVDDYAQRKAEVKVGNAKLDARNALSKHEEPLSMLQQDAANNPKVYAAQIQERLTGLLRLADEQFGYLQQLLGLLHQGRDTQWLLVPEANKLESDKLISIEINKEIEKLAALRKKLGAQFDQIKALNFIVDHKQLNQLAELAESLQEYLGKVGGLMLVLQEPGLKDLKTF